MIEHCAIHADYVGIKTLSGRKVVQITCEVALERLEEVINLLGSPNPSTGKPVGIALLHDVEVDVKREIAEKVGKEKRAFTDLPYSQQAALLCKDKRFWTYLEVTDEDEAAELLRCKIGISSRAELDDVNNANARIEFRRMRDEFHTTTKSYHGQRG